MNANDVYPSLYSLTGDIKDINTLLVPAAQLEAIGAGGVSALRNTWMPDPDTQAVPVAQLDEPTDQQMDSIYRDVWTTVPHTKRLFEFGRRVFALAAAPTTPKE